ncbi:MAG: DUF1508 domain-containing protein [Ruminococcus sp.]|nr:DUF1508 domain-containing protein [Ruminococcus sp.]
MGKFVIKESGKGFSFSLKAGNGEIVATGSKIFNDIDSVKAVIADVTASAPKAAFEDQTVDGFKEEKGAKFELYSDKAGEFRFRLKNSAGDILAVSEGYVKKDSAKNGIESVRKNAADSPVVEAEA